jgi:hypothetical protein
MKKSAISKAIRNVTTTFAAGLLATSFFSLVGTQDAKAQGQGIVAPPQILYQLPGVWVPKQTFGTGTGEGTNYQFQVAIDADPSALNAVNRYTLFKTFLTYANSTTNIWEGLKSDITISGAVSFSGEVNGMHSSITVNNGITATTLESVEAKIVNHGVSTYSAYLSTIQNQSDGTSPFLIGLSLGFQNDNTGAGSVTTYAGINFSSMTGAGTQPTNYFAMRVADANAAIVTSGMLAIGSLSMPTSTLKLYVQTSNTSSGTFGVQIKNSSLANILLIANDGSFNIAGGTMTISNNGFIVSPGIGNGASNLKFNGSAQWTANGAVATAMSSLGPTGSHTTIQTWFTILDSGGTLRYIPAF